MIEIETLLAEEFILNENQSICKEMKLKFGHLSPLPCLGLTERVNPFNVYRIHTLSGNALLQLPRAQ